MREETFPSHQRCEIFHLCLFKDFVLFVLLFVAVCLLSQSVGSWRRLLLHSECPHVLVVPPSRSTEQIKGIQGRVCLSPSAKREEGTRQHLHTPSCLFRRRNTCSQLRNCLSVFILLLIKEICVCVKPSLIHEKLRMLKNCPIALLCNSVITYNLLEFQKWSCPKHCSVLS